MPHDTTLPYLREIVVFLVAAAIVVPLFHRIRVSPVLGFLLTGVAVGPSGLGAVAPAAPWLHLVTFGDPAGVRPIAELGVVFLLFVIGLEMSFARLWALRRLVLGLGPAQIGVSALVIGAIAWAWGNTPAAAIVIGASFALSSTAVVMQELIARAEFATLAGRTAFAVLLCQDLAVVPLLILVPALASGSAGSTAVAIGTGLATALAAGAGLYLLGRWVLRPLFRLAAAARAPEFFVAVTLLTAIGAATVTARAGLGPALGAFMAGLVLSDSEFRHQIEADIAPFKGLLMGLFFISVGMAIDPRAVADLVGWVAAGVVGLVVVKAAVVTLLALAFALPLPAAVQAGLLLGQGGEFALLALGMAMTLGIVPTADGQYMLMVVSLSMLATPGLASLGQRASAVVARRWPPHASGGAPAALAPAAGHVVIAGFGRVGRAVAGLLSAQHVPYVALDLDPARVARHRERGDPVFFGDARRADVLASVGTHDARALVVTLDAADAAEQAVRHARRRWPELPVYARSRDRDHARALDDAGATRSIAETAESSLQLGAVLLGGLGVADEAVSDLVARARESGYEGL